jgi:4-diphosphocytidyl-2-C-methyl-D-erythritol kinase
LLVEVAPAKVNLTLRVVGRRADGYHDIDSLVVFAREGDTLAFAPGDLALTVRGPTASSAGVEADNLVLKAARSLAANVAGLRLGRFTLDKRLPVAAGLGGGSADAAAALRLLARHNSLALDDPRLFAAARATGADVPVCLDPRPRVMRGIGDVLTAPLALRALPAVMVNPGVAVATKDVFAALGLAPGQVRAAAHDPGTLPQRDPELLAYLGGQVNDLEAPAISLQPVIADVLAELRALAGCGLARMSGSGATCFGLFAASTQADAAARALAAAHPGWWVRATSLG